MWKRWWGKLRLESAAPLGFMKLDTEFQLIVHPRCSHSETRVSYVYTHLVTSWGNKAAYSAADVSYRRWWRPKSELKKKKILDFLDSQVIRHHLASCSFVLHIFSMITWFMERKKKNRNCETRAVSCYMWPATTRGPRPASSASIIKSSCLYFCSQAHP